jgi:maltose/moltooligosaccharide transporter
LPYAILAGALPLLCMGVYMGLFNFFIVLPEILAALILVAALVTQWVYPSPASVPANR